jgi:hypothetical protein
LDDLRNWIEDQMLKEDLKVPQSDDEIQEEEESKNDQSFN